MLLNRNPLLAPLLMFCSGILLAHLAVVSFLVTMSLLIALILSTIALPKRMRLPVLLLLIYVLLGFLIHSGSSFFEDRKHFSNIPSTESIVKITKSSRTTKGYMYHGRVLKSGTEAATSTRGKVVIFADSSVLMKKYATYVLPSNFQKVEQLDNDGIFDYGRYLSHLGISHRIFLKQQPLLCDPPPKILSLIVETSAKCENFFLESFSDQRSAAVLCAIFLGSKSDLDPESKQLFLNNGLAHLLAISGMHVGIIYLIVSIFLRWLRIPWIRSSCVILLVWTYIIMTGLQVPAIRAGFMLSILLLGQVLYRNVSNLNSILFAAMFMLAITPKLLFQVSFQLSFSAMCSIILFYKPILSLIKFQKTWASNLWQLVSLNLSVQLFVLPISIYYFHQVPTYTLLTSLVSIPFIVVIMWGSILSISLSPLAFLGSFCIELLENFVQFYLNLLEAFARLPSALISEIELNPWQILAWCFGVLVIYHLSHLGSKKYSFYCFGFLPLVLISSITNIQTRHAKTVILYDDLKSITIDNMVYEETKRIQVDTTYTPYFLRDLPADTKNLLVAGQVMLLDQVSLILIDSPDQAIQVSKIDLCVIGNDSVLENDPAIERLRKNCKHIVVPRSVHVETLPPGFYSVLENGAFKLKIEKR